jgi:hypothetical protein
MDLRFRIPHDKTEQSQSIPSVPPRTQESTEARTETDFDDTIANDDPNMPEHVRENDCGLLFSMTMRTVGSQHFEHCVSARLGSCRGEDSTSSALCVASRKRRTDPDSR